MTDFPREMALLDRQAKALLKRLEDRAPSARAAPFARRMAEEVAEIAAIFGKVEADGDLSEQGKAVRGRRLAGQRINDLRAPSSELRQRAAEAEAALARFGEPPAPAPGVEALLLRQEARSLLRQTKAGERLGLLALDEGLAAAAAEGPPMLSGFKTEQERRDALRQAARAREPERLARLEAEVEGGQIARQLDQTAWQSLAVLARLDEPEAQAFASGETGYCLPEPRPQRAAA